jgi:hypothetical protein
MNFSAKQWAGLALSLIALGISVWAMVLIVILIAHAVGMFIHILILAAIASVLGFAGVGLLSAGSFERLWKVWN